jgi:uncharacterized membrane protein
MKNKTYRTLTALLSGALAMIAGWSITTGNIYIPLIAVAISLGLSYLLKRNVKDITRDERTVLLNQKAAGATIKIFVPLAALCGLILFGSRQRLSAELVSAGYVLSYVACFVMVIHLAFYSYYSRKY